VFLPDPALPAGGRLALYCLDASRPPADALAALGFVHWEPARARVALPGRDGPPVITEVPVAGIALEDALPVLLEAGGASGSLRVWAAVARAALTLATDERMIPTLRQADGRVLGGWSAVADGLVDRLAAALPVAGFALAAEQPGTVWCPEALVSAFVDAVADLAVRRGGEQPRPGRPRSRLLPWTARWAEALVDDSDPSVPLRDDAEELVAGIASWSGSEARPARQGAAELTLRAPGTQDGAWQLELAVRTTDGRAHAAAQVWADAARGDAEAEELSELLLRGLVTAARAYPPLDAVLDTAAPERLALDLAQAEALLEATDRLLESGIVVVLPPELAEGGLALRVRVGEQARRADEPETDEPETDEPTGEPEPQDDEPDDDLDDLALTELGRGAFNGLLTSFRWELALGGEPLTEPEFAALVAASEPLVRVRDRWVRVDEQRRARLRTIGERGVSGELPLAEALALGLAGSEHARSEIFGTAELEDDETVDVVVEGGVADLVERIREAGDRPLAPAVPSGFSGELRPYQQRGVAWLQGMGQLGLGAVLADEMGLGKTIELIAYLLLRGPQARPNLVVCPTSVVGNWQRELARFAPALRVTRHHGPQRATSLDGLDGVVVTSYGTLRRDVDLLSKVRWDVVALDEAQQVKNPRTAAARAVRRLDARQTVALTGTPLENRLAELWSLLDATNPGLLGSRARFGRRFVVPIEQQGDAEAARRLRRLVAPFILRREKGDPAVVADLPDKVERTVVCTLTAEQAALYQAAVDRVLGSDDGLGRSSLMERRGRILALLTELKQICNHPAQYLRDGGKLVNRSGKLEVTRDLVAEAVGGGAQVLVFTQFVAMGHLLVEVLQADLGGRVPFLHGGVAAPARDRMVAAFQGEPDAVAELGGERPPPVLVVSLRAGGTGLNLTAASHVLHFDRWWNPAVEDQATDRAHRIGQSQTVYVHKLVTAGTVEERVAELLERKRDLAEQVVGAGESWVTELGDRELADLVALSADAPVDDDWSAA
jgi:hypothetical protein